jgi:hypothetical protein
MGFEFDEAQLAAVSFLARYRGRTLEAYRHDPLGFFQWGRRPWPRRARSESCAHRTVPRLDGEPRARHLDDRSSPVDGLWLLPVRAPRRTDRLEPRPVRPPTAGPPIGGSRAGSLGARGCSCSPPTSTTGTTPPSPRCSASTGLRLSEACATNIEHLGFERGHRTLRIIGKGNKPTAVPLVPRTARTIDLAVGERHEEPILRRRDGERLDRRTAHRWVRSIGKHAGLGAVHPHMLRAAFIMAALDAGVRYETSRSSPVTPIPAPRPSTTGPPELRPPRRLRRRGLRRQWLTSASTSSGTSRTVSALSVSGPETATNRIADDWQKFDSRG